MIRRLSDEEHALWERLRQSVRPLRKRRVKEAKVEPLGEPPKTAVSKERKSKRLPRPVAATVAARERDRPKAPPPLAPLETKTRRRLARGHVAIDARIDLHGMHQESAFAALSDFVREQQARGARTLLVVTGKGKAGEDGRGVLRRSVPDWLARPDIRPFVVGFEEADRRHGGAGALYVRLRRRVLGPRQD